MVVEIAYGDPAFFLTDTTRPNTNSQTIPADLAARGYTNQLCVDFSHTAVDLMKARHAAHEGIAWHWADVRDLNKEEKDLVPSGSIDVAFDKGTLDAMIHGSPWSPPDQVLSDTSRYMREVGFLHCSFHLVYSSFFYVLDPFFPPSPSSFPQATLFAEVRGCYGRSIALSNPTGFFFTSRFGSRISSSRCCRSGRRGRSFGI